MIVVLADLYNPEQKKGFINSIIKRLNSNSSHKYEKIITNLLKDTKADP